MCQVLPSFITPLGHIRGSPLTVPEEGLKGCAINWSATSEHKKTVGVNGIG